MKCNIALGANLPLATYVCRSSLQDHMMCVRGLAYFTAAAPWFREKTVFLFWLLQVSVVQNAELDAPLLGGSAGGFAEPPLVQDLEQLAKQYAGRRTRAELAQVWRPGLSKLDKLLFSLDAWMGHCPVKLRRQFLQRLQPLVQAAWEVSGAPSVSPAAVLAHALVPG